MRLSDLEKVQHWSDELAKLRSAYAALNDGPTKVEMRFYTGDELPDETPVALIDIHDGEFGPIVALARLRLRTDMNEIADALRDLGAEPDRDWKTKHV
jgi:hypothetical protein